MEVTKVSSTKDILPTLVNLFGLERFNGYIGDDIFDRPDDKGFAYFSNMSWYDGEIYREDVEVTDENREYIEAMDQKMIDCVNINDIIIAGDYFSKDK
jgi:phosphoglycerol transferase MdoB-like AlkP superfamily enzyme